MIAAGLELFTGPCVLVLSNYLLPAFEAENYHQVEQFVLKVSLIMSKNALDNYRLIIMPINAPDDWVTRSRGLSQGVKDVDTYVLIMPEGA